ncbi:MAG: response regulator [Deltaproteobacteria bacterium]|jgi:putative two-component system response regulator|nr:response regulator [Deltaproteobacteria bacterium]
MGSDLKWAKIMVVDDSVTNLRLAKNSLADRGEIFTVPSAKRMLELVGEIKPHLVILDINMPEMSGLEGIKALKAKESTREVPVIFLTANSDVGSEIEGLRLGAVDYLCKPIEPTLLQQRVDIHLTIISQRRDLERKGDELRLFNENLKRLVVEETKKVVSLQGTILDTVVDLVESRDATTGDHVSRSLKWLEALVFGLIESPACPAEARDWDINLLLQSSRLHDVGKITISDAILKKPGPLSPEEFEIMKTHAAQGANIIDRIAQNLPMGETGYMDDARIMALTHHERWDGKGYPIGLSGNDIPLKGRLMAITDVYDALTSSRPYKKPMRHKEAAAIIVAEGGTHFDPSLVGIFESLSDKFVEVGSRGQL